MTHDKKWFSQLDGTKLAKLIGLLESGTIDSKWLPTKGGRFLLS